MNRLHVLLVSAALLGGCKVSFGSGADTKPPTGDGADAPASKAPSADATTSDSGATRTNPEGGATRTNPAAAGGMRANPGTKPTTWAEGLAALDPASDDAFTAVTGLFVEMHPVGKTRASTLSKDLYELIGFVLKIGGAQDDRVRADEALRAAACQSAGYDCGTPTDAAKAELAALQARGIRYYYAGEGTMTVGVDHEGVASAVDAVLDDPSRQHMKTMHASMLFSSAYDEGGYNGPPKLAVDALLQWEALQANAGPYAAIASKGTADARDAYLRLCDHGEYDKPSCQASKELQASYNGFAKAHPDSPSAPVVKAFVSTMRRRRWKATRAQLDAAVTSALEQLK
ncbi:MAG: hypothetical protein AAGA54_06200 [Myxococcota bacterium]